MKTVYAVGSDEVNPAGLVLTVTYADGRTEDIAYNGGSKNARQFTFSDIDFNEIGEQEVLGYLWRTAGIFHGSGGGSR